MRKCRFIRGRVGEQNIPEDILKPAFRFDDDVDIFRPFLIKKDRKELNRYVELFSCLFRELFIWKVL